MSILSFAFYVTAVYIAYYLLMICYDLFSEKTKVSLGGEEGVQYDFGNIAIPKIAQIDDSLEGDSGSRKISFDNGSETATEDLNQEVNATTSVDLSLENVRSNSLNKKR